MPTATSLITGFLGAGKTTAIAHLLSQRPADEQWAVLVNEFGQVSIDGAVLGGDEDVAVRELPGGCLCCTLGAPLRVTLTRLLREVKPHRLLIEPTGLGHPARVLDTLRAPGLAESLTLGATVCLVDPRRLGDPRVRSHPVFVDQAQMADVLVASKCDLADPQALEAFRAWAAGHYPPKQLVTEITHGRLDVALLDRQPGPPRFALFPDAHAAADESSAEALPFLALPGRPVRRDNQGLGRQSCGWVFHPQDCFDRVRLTELLGTLPSVERLKGVFHCGRDWLLMDRAGEELRVEPVGWRSDSRLEVIIRQSDEIGWDRLEGRLLACLSTP